MKCAFKNVSTVRGKDVHYKIDLLLKNSDCVETARGRSLFRVWAGP